MSLSRRPQSLTNSKRGASAERPAYLHIHPPGRSQLSHSCSWTSEPSGAVLELEEVQVWPPLPTPLAAYLSSACSISGQVTQLTPVSNSQTDDITPFLSLESNFHHLCILSVFPSGKNENVLRPLRLQWNVVSQIHSRAELSEISLEMQTLIQEVQVGGETVSKKIPRRCRFDPFNNDLCC